MLFAPALLALALHGARPAADGPALALERAGHVSHAQAALVRGDGSAHLAVDFKVAFPALAARRTVVVEALGADGQLLFTRSVVARHGMNDARQHRSVRARARVALPDLAGVARLRVRAGG